MRIGVLEIGGTEQCALLLEHGDDDGIGGPDGLPLKRRQSSQRPCIVIHVHVAGSVHAAGLIEVVALAGIEVVCTVRRRSVDGAGAGVGGDVGGQNAEDAALEEGVLEGGVFELRAFETREFLGRAEPAGGDDRGGQVPRRRYTPGRLARQPGSSDRRWRSCATYSKSGWKATAMDAGSVQGVVVQMMV